MGQRRQQFYQFRSGQYPMYPSVKVFQITAHYALCVQANLKNSSDHVLLRTQSTQPH
jgi:hypothetical protein